MNIGFGIDWFNIITKLERAGLTLEDIGTHVGKNASTICRYKVGIEPRHSVGEMLIHLYQSRCGST